MSTNEIMQKISQGGREGVRKTEITKEFKKAFIDETGYEGNIDIVVKGSVLDSFSLNGLKAELIRYNLDLKETFVKRNVLVFKKRDN